MVIIKQRERREEPSVNVSMSNDENERIKNVDIVNSNEVFSRAITDCIIAIDECRRRLAYIELYLPAIEQTFSATIAPQGSIQEVFRQAEKINEVTINAGNDEASNGDD